MQLALTLIAPLPPIGARVVNGGGHALRDQQPERRLRWGQASLFDWFQSGNLSSLVIDGKRGWMKKLNSARWPLPGPGAVPLPFGVDRSRACRAGYATPLSAGLRLPHRRRTEEELRWDLAAATRYRVG